MTREVIDAAAFLAFWVLLVIGAMSVTARVAYYRTHGYRQPRLLTRDAIMLVGFSLSFGFVLFARVAVANGADTSWFRESVVWGLLTAGPAIVAVATFAYFELFVIERGAPERERRTHLELQRPEDHELDPRVPD